MRLYEEIFQGEQSVAARAVLLVGGGAYFEGVKAVGDFSEEKLTLHFAKGNLDIEGEGLRIRKYCDGDLALDGRVRLVRLTDERSVGKGE